MSRDRRDLIAWQDLDIAISVGEGAVGGKLQRIEEARVNKGVARVKLPLVRFERDLRLDALASSVAYILEKAEALQNWTWDGENVVRILGSECAHLPRQMTDIEVLCSAKTGFHGTGNNLFQRRIGNEERGDHARVSGIGAFKLERGRRAVRFRIAGISRQARRDLVGAT